MSISRPIKLLAGGTILLAAGALGYWVLYENPRRDLMEQIRTQLTLNDSLDHPTHERARIRQELREIAETTLGTTADRVDARFRSAVQRIADTCGLSGVQISTRSPDDVKNPIASARRRIPNMPNLSREVDFRVVRGELSGTGTLEQVLRATAMMQVQPWIHRVESFSIIPPAAENREQDRYTLRLGISTLMLDASLSPREAAAAGEPEIAQLPADASLAWAALVQKNPFREPPPRRTAEKPKPAPAQAAQAVKPPAPPPYNEWRLTGVVESRLGTEAFLVNTRSDERMSIGAGASIAGARLVAAEGERAIFEIEGEEYEVFNGQTLEQRRPSQGPR